MKFSLIGRCIVAISIIFVFSHSYGMEAQAGAKQSVQEDGLDALAKSVNAPAELVKQVNAAHAQIRCENAARPNPFARQYHLIPYYQKNQGNHGLIRSLLNYVGNFLMPTIYPDLQRGTYPAQGPELINSLAKEVQASVNEEARMRSWNYFFRRMAGSTIMGEIGFSLLGGFHHISKYLFNRPFFLKTDFKSLTIVGLILAAGVIATREVLRRLQEIPNHFEILNAHRLNIKRNGLVTPDVAQQLKALPKFQNNPAAYHVINQMMCDAV